MTHSKYSSKTSYLVLCGLFTALTAVCSYITIPLPFTPIPMNLGTLAVFLAGALLGSKYGAISMAVYALAGIAGIPVFAGFQAGPGVLAGPTGGFIAGYIATAFLIGFILEHLPKRTSPPAGRAGELALCMAAMAAGAVLCYCFGTLWFMVVMKAEFIAAVTMCVVPFIPADIIKIIAASILVRRLRPFI